MRSGCRVKMTGIKAALTIALFLLAIGLGAIHGGVSDITRPVPGRITVNVLSIQASADVDGNGRVDIGDLKEVSRKLNTSTTRRIREDINHDGVVDVVDLAIVARHFGQVVTA